jgi:hypothetical protein
VATPANYYNVQAETSSTSSTAHTCGNGYLCTGGATGPYQSACPANTVAGAAATTCTPCTIGKYCPIGSALQLDCPIGFYCDGVSLYPTKCPRGTFGGSTNLGSAANCSPCPAGFTCSQAGLVAADGPCDPGFYCTGGSWSPRPQSTVPAEAATGGLCPAGAYCPRGSTTPQSCPAGTYNSFPGMRASTDCISCTPGFYCSGSSNPTPAGPCSAGYYCTGGSDNP